MTPWCSPAVACDPAFNCGWPFPLWRKPVRRGIDRDLDDPLYSNDLWRFPVVVARIAAAFRRIRNNRAGLLDTNRAVPVPATDEISVRRAGPRKSACAVRMHPIALKTHCPTPPKGREYGDTTIAGLVADGRRALCT